MGTFLNLISKVTHLRLSHKSFKKTSEVPEMTEEEAFQIVISDLQQAKTDNENFIFWQGDKKYSAHQLLIELKGETDVGKKYVKSFIEGCTFFSAKKD